MKKISLLGASGSIGVQTLDIIRMHPDMFSLVAFSVGKNVEKAVEIAEEFKPKLLSVQKKEDADSLRRMISRKTKIVYGDEGLLEVACHHESTVLVNAILEVSAFLQPYQRLSRERQLQLPIKKRSLQLAI